MYRANRNQKHYITNVVRGKAPGAVHQLKEPSDANEVRGQGTNCDDVDSQTAPERHHLPNRADSQKNTASHTETKHAYAVQPECSPPWGEMRTPSFTEDFESPTALGGRKRILNREETLFPPDLRRNATRQRNQTRPYGYDGTE